MDNIYKTFLWKTEVISIKDMKELDLETRVKLRWVPPPGTV